MKRFCISSICFILLFSLTACGKAAPDTIVADPAQAILGELTVQSGNIDSIHPGDRIQFFVDHDDKGVTWAVVGNEKPGTLISQEGLLVIGADETARQMTVSVIANSDPSVRLNIRIGGKEEETSAIIVEHEPETPAETKPAEPDTTPSANVPATPEPVQEPIYYTPPVYNVPVYTPPVYTEPVYIPPVEIPTQSTVPGNDGVTVIG